eukprot:CAMPEP_0171080898 /NCGR_PEP_ID=MMETSP0766_2-20121228/16161_1 /TAXON_ID=439317 /ORGANISM="Gambierdiscus australes, Strain CAWD 149" /LENGTH=444 /DNA_ID=CAMNT_0011538175 /DNA_START=1 /DNA_END=1335 /DNA_ORIENTATION=+
MRIGCHDMGGLDSFYGPVDKSAPDYEQWELSIHAAALLCFGKGLLNLHQFRRGIEEMQPEAYAAASYYERWAVTLTKNLLEAGVLSQSALDARFGIGAEQAQPLFSVGDHVRVRAENTKTRWRKPHVRTPGYIFGCEGVVERICGEFADPMLCCFGNSGIKQPLYRVRFSQRQLWPEYAGDPDDTVDIEIYQTWLEQPGTPQPSLPPAYRDACPIRWDGTWVTVHETRSEAEVRAAAAQAPPGRFQPLAEALLEELVEQGVFDREELAARREDVSNSFGEKAAGFGRKLVAKAWTDAHFKALLQRDWKAACEEAGIELTQRGLATNLLVLEDTQTVRNLVVCTLCSCWPSYFLGNAPAWYKSSSYRARAVREPRAVLAEFGVNVPTGVSVRVHDSTADMRYMVLPQRPAGTEDWGEERLATLVTRDCMVGCGMPLAPTLGEAKM